ncbi:MAG TPA: tetratricopeptide repeat protein [Bryobacteraceae bacterium]|nr:tetratricopeptide repeat protein [Bryobacteraceae bacterium]
MSTAPFLGFLCLAFSLQAQIWLGPRGQADPFPSTMMTTAGDRPLMGNLNSFAPSRAGSLVVSLHELEHPTPQKALREAYEAQELARQNKIAKAIAKLEDAVRIAPEFRDAHVNLGVQYARVGRMADARAQLEKALAIGPPVATIYFDLAVAALHLGQRQEAEIYAQKARQLDPDDKDSKRALGGALNH